MFRLQELEKREGGIIRTAALPEQVLIANLALTLIFLFADLEEQRTCY